MRSRIPLFFIFFINLYINAQAQTPAYPIGTIVKNEEGKPIFEVKASSVNGFIYELKIGPGQKFSDHATGLEWMKQPRTNLGFGKDTWYETEAWIRSLGKEWRFPTIYELETEQIKGGLCI